MPGLNTRFQSLPALGKRPENDILDSTDGAVPLLHTIKSAPTVLQLPGSGNEETPLPALLQQMSLIQTAEEPKLGIKRLQTYQAVITALGEEEEDKVSPMPGMPTRPTKLKSQPTLAQRFTKLIPGFKSVSEDEEEFDSYQSLEKKAYLAELSKRTKGRTLYRQGTFQAAMNIKGEEFAGRLFHALDVNGSGTVTDEQLVNTLLSLKHGTLKQKIAFIWSFVADNSTCITRRELQMLLKASCSEGELRLDDKAIENLAAAFFNKAGKHNAHVLSIEDFSAVLESRAELRESLNVGGVTASADDEHRMAVKNLPWYERGYSRFCNMFQIENPQLVWLVFLMILGECAGFVAGFVQNDSGDAFTVERWSLPVAKGAARSMQVILIIFPFTVARSLLTFLRKTPLHYILPLDEHIDLHKILAYHFFFWGFVHTGAHIANGYRVGHCRTKFASRLAMMTPKQQMAFCPYGSQAAWYRQETQVTGVMLSAILFFCYLFAIKWPQFGKDTKKKLLANKFIASLTKATSFLRGFEAFYYTHIFMAVSVLVLLIIHPYPGPVYNPKPHKSTTWVYLVAGTFIYILERILRIMRQLFWTTSLIGVKLHKGGVTELRLRKPKSRAGFQTFPGKAGQYCFLNIPKLAEFEWHPFSLTSGPNDDFISFHIRSLGDWTTALYKHCEENLMPDASEPKETHLDTNGLVVKSSPLSVLTSDLKINVDGPFGAPAQDHSHFDCLVLVGAGIGATPFASILRQLLDEYQRSLCSCCKTVNQKLFAPRKVYFYWIASEQTAPQYFKDTLEEITSLDTSRFFDISIYLSRVKVQQGDLRVTIAKVAQLIQHEESGYDALSATYQPVPCYFGKPCFPTLFDKIQREHAGSKVGVFVCGPTPLCAQIKGECKTHSMKNKDKEFTVQDRPCEFIFHQEHF